MIQLNDSGVRLNNQEGNRFYYDETKRYSGITGMIGQKLFPTNYDGIPKKVLQKAMERGNRIHSELTTCDVLGIATSEEAIEYKRLIEKLGIKILANEYIVSDKKHHATPIDKVGQKNGKLILIDVKATYKLNNEYLRWQLSLGKLFFEIINPHLKVDELWAIHVKDGVRFVKIEPIKEEHLYDLIQAHIDGTDYANPLALDTKLTRKEVKNELKKREQMVEKTETALVIISPDEYGLQEQTAKDLTKGLDQVLMERELLAQEFETVSKLEISEETTKEFKALRLKLQKNRTQGINAWHKKSKEYFLRGGQFLDAIKNREIAVNEGMEKVLMEGEKYFENREKERLEKLQTEREIEMDPYMEVEEDHRDYTKFDESEFEVVLGTKKKAHEAKVEAEKKAEKERLEAEQKEAKEKERLQKENAKLLKAQEKEKAKAQALQQKIEAINKKQAEKEKAEKEKAEKEAKAQAEREAKAQKERDAKEKAEKAKADAIQRELDAIKEAEAKRLLEAEKAKAEEKRKAEEKLQLELSKGDKDKLQDLKADLETLKTKYTFKAQQNKETYETINEFLNQAIKAIK